MNSFHKVWFTYSRKVLRLLSARPIFCTLHRNKFNFLPAVRVASTSSLTAHQTAVSGSVRKRFHYNLIACDAGSMADGRWQMADGRWQMADGRWQKAIAGNCRQLTAIRKRGWNVIARGINKAMVS